MGAGSILPTSLAWKNRLSILLLGKVGAAPMGPGEYAIGGEYGASRMPSPTTLFGRLDRTLGCDPEVGAGLRPLVALLLPVLPSPTTNPPLGRIPLIVSSCAGDSWATPTLDLRAEDRGVTLPASTTSLTGVSCDLGLGETRGVRDGARGTDLDASGVEVVLPARRGVSGGLVAIVAVRVVVVAELGFSGRLLARSEDITVSLWPMSLLPCVNVSRVYVNWCSCVVGVCAPLLTLCCSPRSNEWSWVQQETNCRDPK